MSIEVVKKIVSTFLKKEVDSINSNTYIDNSAIPGSVLIHRMYSELSKNGFTIRDPARIKTFGDLDRELFSSEASNDDSNIGVRPNYENENTNVGVHIVDANMNGIGIDIESSSNLPDTNDYFEEQFYIDNFSQSEIAYCSAKLNPKSCFTGRFSAKEAIIKADNTFINTKFSDIEIKVSDSGSPLFNGMNISISHLNIGDVQISTAIAQKHHYSSNGNNIKEDVDLTIKDDIPDNIIPASKESKKLKYSLIFILITLIILIFNINIDIVN